MKKRYIIPILIGIVIMVIGGVGGITFFFKAQNSMTTTIDENWKTDKTNSLTVNLDGFVGESLEISSSDDSSIRLEGSTSSYISDKLAFNYQKEKSHHTLHISGPKAIRDDIDQFLSADWWNSDTFLLSIPNEIQNLTIITQKQSIHLNAIELENLIVKSKSGEVALDSVDVKNNNISSERGLVQISKTRSDETVLQSKTATINLNDTQSKKLSIDSLKGYLHIEKNLGNTQLSSVHGSIKMSDLSGNIVATTDTGDIEMQSNIPENDVKLDSNTGNIYFISKEKPKNATIDIATSNKKTVFYTDKKKKSESYGEKKYRISLNSKLGSIFVEQEKYEWQLYDDNEEENFDDEINEDFE